MLNLNASLTKAGKKYSTLWSEDFTDEFFVDGLRRWLHKGEVKHPTKHVTPLKKIKIPSAERNLGKALAEQLAREKAIMGIFDEGCMGMYNAIIPDELLHPMGVYKERLSQSALYYETTQVGDDEAWAVRRWMEERGMKFVTGPNEETDLTDRQILTQCKMYIAAVRIADDFGCNTIGIQYQQGLEGPVAGQRPGRGHAEQCRPPAGPQPRRQPRAVRRPAGAALQRSGRVRRPGRPDDLPRPQGDGPAGREHPARRSLGRLGPLGHGERLRLGVSDQRFRAAGAI